MKELTIQEILALVTFTLDANGSLVISDVFGYVSGSVLGNVCGNVEGDIGGCVGGSVGGDVKGEVKGEINGYKWRFVETSKEKTIRLIREGRGDEAIKVLQEYGL